MIRKSGNRDTKSLFSNRYWGAMLLFFLAVLIYSNTFHHDYTLDDAIVITKNEYTKKGIAGIGDIFSNDSFAGFFGEKKSLVPGGRYRPLSIATFAMEYEIWGNNPAGQHMVNVLLYAFVCALLFLVFFQLTGNNSQRWVFSAVFISVLLYTVHPVHTEVVANIKGRDEILALLFSILALQFFYNYLKTGNLLHTTLIFLFFLLALLSKENAMTFVLIIPLTAYFFMNKPLKKILAGSIPLILSAILFLVIRQSMIGPVQNTASEELMNNPFLNADSESYYATVIYILGRYIKLLVFPHPLTYDYYPYHIELQEFDNFWVVVPLLGYLLLILIAIILLPRKNPVSYAILFYLITLLPVSNMFFTVGTFMNERFLFIPSVGFMLLAGFIIAPVFTKKSDSSPAHMYLFIIPVVFLFAAKTWSRNKVWKNDHTLFTTDVRASAGSAKSNCTAGGALIEASENIRDTIEAGIMLDQAISYLKKSIRIHPDYNDALLLLGNAMYKKGYHIDSTLFYYKQILERDPTNTNVYNNLDVMIARLDDPERKIAAYEDLLQFKPERFSVYYQLGNLYGKHLNNVEKALEFLLIAYSINPQNAAVCKDLGVAYGLKPDYERSLEFLLKARELDPNDAKNLVNIGITYRRMGKPSKADSVFRLVAGEESEQ